jgi:hypothetical protein
MILTRNRTNKILDLLFFRRPNEEASESLRRCGAIGSILQKDVLACDPAAETDCLGGIAASVRGAVPVIN